MLRLIARDQILIRWPVVFRQSWLLRFGSDGSLILCGPSDSKMRRASRFEGTGLCIMRPVEESGKQREPGSLSSLTKATQPHKTPFEPDPEFSRNSTEEPPHPKVLEVMSDNLKRHWMQEKGLCHANASLVSDKFSATHACSYWQHLHCVPHQALLFLAVALKRFGNPGRIGKAQTFSNHPRPTVPGKTKKPWNIWHQIKRFCEPMQTWSSLIVLKGSAGLCLTTMLGLANRGFHQFLPCPFGGACCGSIHGARSHQHAHCLEEVHLRKADD